MNTTKLIEDADGNLIALYKALLALTGGDEAKTDILIDKLIAEQEEKLNEGLEEIEESKRFATIARNLPATREAVAYDTSREFFRTAVKDGTVLTAEQEKLKIKFYGDKPLEAAEDGIVL